MAVWIQNLKTRLEDRPVVILHGNVRDRYIDENGQIYDNLTKLLEKVAGQLPQPFSEIVFYDPVGGERRTRMAPPSAAPSPMAAGDAELASTAPEGQLEKKRRPTQVLEQWNRQLSSGHESRFVVLFYLDKLVAYKTAFQEEERETLLRLEKLIENISANNRLVLVALQDTMVPTELYTHSPKAVVLSIPSPDKSDRDAYLKHRLGGQHDHLNLIADLTDGLFLHDLDNIAAVINNRSDFSTREVRRLVNKYRIGEQEDHWGLLDIDKLNGAMRCFVEEKGVKGQEEALQKVIGMLSLARAGLAGMASGTPSKPQGVLFFAGPTGVGKTFVAKKLADFLFNTEEAFLRFDMSEYKEEHTVSKLIGSPPGYVGFEQGGMLTNAVRDRPFAVILFDEVEKAHPKIMDIFLQILDEGRLTDSRGQTVFFTETVIIFTSNLGTRTTDSRGAPSDERRVLDSIVTDDQMDAEEKKRRVREHFTRAVERFFMFEISRPELLNRIGNNIVPFNYIHTPEVQRQIVDSHLRRIQDDFEDRHRSTGYQLVFDSSISPWLVQKYGERITLFGGRGITNAIEDEIMIPLAYAVLYAEHQHNQQVRFVLKASIDGKIDVRER